MNIINEVLEACVSSAKAEKITIKEGNKDFQTRAQLHTLLLMPFGAGKTTEIVDIPDSFQVTDFTLPGFLGTISKMGEFVPGAVSEAAGKVLVVDEFHNLGEKPRQAMLNLLEHQIYARNLGYKVLVPKKISKRYCKIKVKNNWFTISSRFSCLCSGIYVSRKRINDMAWLSRFMPICLDVSVAEAYDLSMGKKIFNIKPKKYIETPYFEDYEKFWRTHKEMVLNSKFADFYMQKSGFLRRNILDFCRLFSYTSRANSVVDDWEQYIPYIPFFLHNYLSSTLTLTEYEIMSMIKSEINHKEIAIKVGVSEVYVSNVKKKLGGLNLV